MDVLYRLSYKGVRTCRKGRPMKILQTTPRTELVEIGPLDHRLRLPMEGRLARKLPTRCAVCGEETTDEYFIGGFQEGRPNLLLHESCALDSQS